MTQDNLSAENLTDVYHALRAQRRCYVIERLWDHDSEQITVRTLAREIAAKEEGVSLENATGEPYRAVYNSLSQTHMQTLHDSGVLIYDNDRQTARPGPNFTVAVLIIAINRTTFRVLTHVNAFNRQSPIE